MEKFMLLNVAAAARQAIAAFGAEQNDPRSALQALADEIDRTFDAAMPMLAPAEREIADEVHAVLLDQIAATQRAAVARLKVRN